MRIHGHEHEHEHGLGHGRQFGSHHGGRGPEGFERWGGGGAGRTMTTGGVWPSGRSGPASGPVGPGAGAGVAAAGEGAAR